MKIAFIRGPHLNPFELQTYAPLVRSQEFLAIGADWQAYPGPLNSDIPIQKASAWGGSLKHFGPQAPVLFNRSLSWTTGRSYGLYDLQDIVGRPDIVHSAEVFSTMTFQCLALKRQLGCRLVVTVWENLPHRGELHPLRKLRKYQMIHEADGILAVTETTRTMLIEEGVPREKIQVIPMGVDLKRFHPAPKDPALCAKLGIRPDELVILYIGRFSPEKGVKELMAAIPGILQRSGTQKVRFLFVGEGPQLPDVHKVQKQLNGALIIHPFVLYEEIPKIHNLADIFVLPSINTPYIQEQFGFVLIESMACGKPIVTTRAGSIPDVVGDAAVVVEGGSSRALEDGIVRMLDGEFRSRMAHLAADRARHVFDAEKIAPQITQLYQSVLQKAPADAPIRVSSATDASFQMKNYAYKLAGEFGVRVLSTAFLLILARIVGAADFGVYSTAFAFASVFMIFVDLGVNPILTREIARYPDKRPQIIASVNFLKTFTAGAMLVCLWIVTSLVDFSIEKTRLIHWFGWVVIGTAFTEYISAIFTGLEQMGVEAILKVITKGVVIVAALVALAQTGLLYPTVKVMGLFSIVSIILGTTIARYRIGAFGFRADWTYIRGLLARSMPIFGSWAFLTLYDSQDILILNYFKIADHQIGLFALSVKIIDVLKIFPLLLASAFFPLLARHAHLSRESFRDRARELWHYASIGLPLITAAVYFAAPIIILALYGQGYQDAVPSLRLLLVGFFIMAFNILFLQILIALDKEKESLWGSAVVCVSNLAFSCFLVPRYGMIGACYALILSEALYLGVQNYLLKRVYASEGPK